MELKEGMYIRTKDGFIDKVIIDYKGCCNSPICNCKHVSCEHDYYDEEAIVKASDNLIDLIDVGDYVNGLPVAHNATKNGGNIVILINGDAYNEEGIKDIVTKEQFNSVKYEVE